MKTPFLSIITVNYNNNTGLQETLESIKTQSYTNYEHIIIDANSTDSSKETISQYAKETSHLSFWVSEPDKGIYDGMNKGIEHANGEYIYFLNSGDCLFDNSVLASIPFDGTRYICGNMQITHSAEQHEIVIPPESIDGLFLIKEYLPHPSSFIHHSLFERKKYDSSYKIISDWIHMIENIVLNGCSYKHINVLVSDFDNTGVSSSNRPLGLAEREKWITENIPTPIYRSFMELDQLKNSVIGHTIPITLQKSARTQRKMKKVILFLSKILK